MYQFTRDFIINDNKGKLNGGVKFQVNPESNTLMVDHMCNIRKQDVAHIYKTVGVDEKVEKVNINPTATVADGDIIRLVITLGQENRVHPLFNDNYPDHTQSFIYEAKATGTSLPLDKLVEAMTAERNRFDNLYFTAEYNKTKGIILTLMDCYTRLVGLRLVKVPADHSGNANLASQLTGYQDYTVLGDIDFKNRQEILGGTSKGITLEIEGNAGVNTTNYIVQNVRLLTDANINPYGVNMDERPLPRSVYDQYTVECISERRHIGHQVMGSIDHSLTTYVFFVIQSESASFASELAKIGTIEDAKQLPTNEVKATKVNISTYTAPVDNIIATAADLKANASADADTIKSIDALKTSANSEHEDIKKRVKALEDKA